MDVLFAMFTPGPMEMMIILGIAVLLFGKRLPEVGRSLGKGIVEFKKGVRGIEDEVESAASAASTPTAKENADDRDEATAPKFEPPKAEPKPESAGQPQAESTEEGKAESGEA